MLRLCRRESCVYLQKLNETVVVVFIFVSLCLASVSGKAAIFFLSAEFYGSVAYFHLVFSLHCLQAVHRCSLLLLIDVTCSMVCVSVCLSVCWAHG